jgi:Mrr N-terminal domain
MTLTIEIDDEVFAALQKLATPLIDSPNDVLRRVLDLDVGQRTGSVDPPTLPDKAAAPKSAASKQGELEMTPQREFRRYIVDIINEHGGKAHMQDVLGEIEARMNDRFKPGDLQNVSTGEVRWRNAARWERMQMANEGLIKKGTASGWWELTADGRKA